jgi:hypothetical protein
LLFTKELEMVKQCMAILFVACAALCIASVANADMMTIYDTSSSTWVPVGTVVWTYTRNAYNGLSKVEYVLGSWLAPGYSGATINIIAGTWSITGSEPTGAYLSNPTGYSWKDDTAGYVWKGHYYAPDPPQSYVNLDVTIANATWTRTASSAAPVAGNMYSAFHGGWYADASIYNIGVGGTIAVLYVSPNAGKIIFTADGDPDGLGTTAGTFKKCIITMVPEPGALALLTMGLVGLLAYAWRKRK